VYNSADIPKLKALLASGLPPMEHGFSTHKTSVNSPMAA
jgi:hypothetical protein